MKTANRGKKKKVKDTSNEGAHWRTKTCKLFQSRFQMLFDDDDDVFCPHTRGPLKSNAKGKQVSDRLSVTNAEWKNIIFCHYSKLFSFGCSLALHSMPHLWRY